MFIMYASNIELIHQPKRINDRRDNLCSCGEVRFKIYLISHKQNMSKHRDDYEEPQHRNLLAKSASRDISIKTLNILRKIEFFFFKTHSK